MKAVLVVSMGMLSVCMVRRKGEGVLVLNNLILGFATSLLYCRLFWKYKVVRKKVRIRINLALFSTKEVQLPGKN